MSKKRKVSKEELNKRSGGAGGGKANLKSELRSGLRSGLRSSDLRSSD